MAQSIFGGATSYKEQSLNDIKSDIIKWIKYTKDIQMEMNNRLNKAKENGYWISVGYDFQMTVSSSIAFFQTILDDLDLIVNSIDHNTITARDITLLQKIGRNSINYNVNIYPKSFKGHENYSWHDYGNPDFCNIEDMYAHGRDFFVTLQDAVNAASRLEDYMNTQNTINNTMNINGNVSNSQFQQGTINSSQSQNISNDFDYSKALEILSEIQKYTSTEMFDQDFGINADELRQLINEAIECAQQKTQETKIQNALQHIKNIASGISTGIIANGIFQIIQSGFPFL